MNSTRSMIPIAEGSVDARHTLLTRPIVTTTLLALLVGAGLYFRFVGLGLWSIASDEYHSVAAARLILLHGLPEFLDGGYYTRGLVFHYVLAGGFAALPLDHLTSARLLTAVMSAGAIPAVWLIGRQLGGRGIALLAVGLFSLSVWEVETARYARMYGPFQTVAVWYLYFLIRSFTTASARPRYIAWGLSLFGVLVSETAIFLCLLNFLPWFDRRRALGVQHFLVPFAILVCVFVFLSADFRGVRAEFDISYADTLRTTEQTSIVQVGPALFPKLPLLAQDSWLFLSVWAIAACGMALVTLRAWRESSAVQTKLSLAAITVSVASGLLLLAGTVAAFALALEWHRNLPRRQLLRFAGGMAVASALWVIVLAGEAALAAEGGLAPKELLRGIRPLLSFPATIDQVVHPWLKGMAPTTVLLLSAFALTLGRSLLDQRRISEALRALLVSAIVVFAAAGVIATPQASTRYTLMLHPMLILALCWGLRELYSVVAPRSRPAAFGAVAVAAFALLCTTDYSAAHLLKIDSFDVAHRVSFKPGAVNHLRDRMDVQSTARFINDHLQSGDKIVSTVRHVEYHDLALDYYYRDISHPDLISIATAGGSRERWTGAKLLYRKDALDELLSEPGRIWLITRHPDHLAADRIERSLAQDYAAHRLFDSPDMALTVYRTD